MTSKLLSLNSAAQLWFSDSEWSFLSVCQWTHWIDFWYSKPLKQCWCHEIVVLFHIPSTSLVKLFFLNCQKHFAVWVIQGTPECHFLHPYHQPGMGRRTQSQLLILLATDPDIGMVEWFNQGSSEPCLDSCTAIIGDGASFSRLQVVWHRLRAAAACLRTQEQSWVYTAEEHARITHSNLVSFGFKLDWVGF